MAIKPDPSPQKSIDNPNSTAIYIDTKIRQAAAKDIQRSYRNLKRSSSHNMDESSLTQTYLMLDRALSEAQSQKELCKNKQTINDDVTYISTEEEDGDELESRCHERSQCGLNGCMHELLMDSGEFFYDCFGKPL